jgi:hypothetical protein
MDCLSRITITPVTLNSLQLMEPSSLAADDGITQFNPTLKNLLLKKKKEKTSGPDRSSPSIECDDDILKTG